MRDGEAAAGLERGGGGDEGRRRRWRRASVEIERERERALGRIGIRRETRSRFWKSEVELAISIALRATGDRGSAFAIRPRSQGVCAGLFAYWAQKLSKRCPKQGVNIVIKLKLLYVS